MIDFHVHYYPQEITEDPGGWGLRRKEYHWRLLHAPEQRPSLQSFVSAETMLADMDAAGVTRCVIQGWYWEHPETCRWHNTITAGLIERYPQHFSGFGSVNLQDKVNLKRDLHWLADHGFSGIGELFPPIQGYSFDDPAWQQLCHFSAERGWPICLHVTEPVGRNYPGRVTADLQGYVDLIRLFPEVNFVLAHWGGLLFFHHLHRQTGLIPSNIYYDSAASPLLYRTADLLPLAIELAGADRILYGSDYPLRLYPSRQKQADMLRFCAEMIRHLPPSQRAAIMGGNAARLLGEP